MSDTPSSSQESLSSNDSQKQTINTSSVPKSSKFYRIPHCRIFLGNLASERTSKEELYEIFSKYGNIIEDIVLRKSFGFIQYDNPESAIAAIKAENGRIIGGMKVDLNIADNREPKAKREKSPPRDRLKRKRRSPSPVSIIGSRTSKRQMTEQSSSLVRCQILYLLPNLKEYATNIENKLAKEIGSFNVESMLIEKRSIASAVDQAQRRGLNYVFVVGRPDKETGRAQLHIFHSGHSSVHKEISLRECVEIIKREEHLISTAPPVPSIPSIPIPNYPFNLNLSPNSSFPLNSNLVTPIYNPNPYAPPVLGVTPTPNPINSPSILGSPIDLNLLSKLLQNNSVPNVAHPSIPNVTPNVPNVPSPIQLQSSINNYSSINQPQPPINPVLNSLSRFPNNPNFSIPNSANNNGTGNVPSTQNSLSSIEVLQSLLSKFNNPNNGSIPPSPSFGPNNTTIHTNPSPNPTSNPNPRGIPNYNSNQLNYPQTITNLTPSVNSINPPNPSTYTDGQISLFKN